MSVVVIKGDPEKGGIPRKSRVRLEDLATRRYIFSGEASGSIHLDLDPGGYVGKVHCRRRGMRTVSYTFKFFHEMDEKTYNRLKRWRPKFSTARQTSKGLIYTCSLVGCEHETSSRIYAVMHDGAHKDINVLTTPITEDEFDEATRPKAVGIVPDKPKKGREASIG